MRTFKSGRIIEDAALLAAADRLEALAVVKAPVTFDDKANQHRRVIEKVLGRCTVHASNGAGRVWQRCYCSRSTAFTP
jgi:hypothetical protein